MPSEPTVPLVDVPERIASELTRLGAPRSASALKLYRALANQPDLLAGWIEFAWRLRLQATTPRSLRELMILRGAQIANCEYELETHGVMARAAGVSTEELNELADWRSSSAFSPSARAALEFVEAMCDGFVPDAVNADLAKHFDASERVELILTAGMYTMVPRVINALRLSHEGTST